MSASVETNQATKVAKSKVRTVKRKAIRAAKSPANARRKVAWAKRESVKRSAAVRRHAKWKSASKADRRRKAIVVVQQRRKAASLAVSSQSTTSEGAIQRRFRGFIAKTSMANNAFEVMRKPRLDSSHMAPPAPITRVAMVAPSMDEGAAAAVAPAPAVQSPAAQSADTETTGSASFQLASASEVIVSEPPAAKPAQVVATAAPAETPDSSLPLRELFLALCGALTAASALRFVVGA